MYCSVVLCPVAPTVIGWLGFNVVPSSTKLPFEARVKANGTFELLCSTSGTVFVSPTAIHVLESVTIIQKVTGLSSYERVMAWLGAKVWPLTTYWPMLFVRILNSVPSLMFEL
jgi:hypothetical protein